MWPVTMWYALLVGIFVIIGKCILWLIGEGQKKTVNAKRLHIEGESLASAFMNGPEPTVEYTLTEELGPVQYCDGIIKQEKETTEKSGGMTPENTGCSGVYELDVTYVGNVYEELMASHSECQQKEQETQTQTKSRCPCGCNGPINLKDFPGYSGIVKDSYPPKYPCISRHSERGELKPAPDDIEKETLAKRELTNFVVGNGGKSYINDGLVTFHNTRRLTSNQLSKLLNMDGAKYITSLDLTGTAIGNISLYEIGRKLPQLKKLYLDETDITFFGGLDGIKHLHLDHLSLYNMMDESFYHSHSTTEQDIPNRYKSYLPNVKQFVIGDEKVGRRTFQQSDSGSMGTYLLSLLPEDKCEEEDELDDNRWPGGPFMDKRIDEFVKSRNGELSRDYLGVKMMKISFRDNKDFCDNDLTSLIANLRDTGCAPYVFVLDLSYTNVGNEGLNNLSVLTNLESLSLKGLHFDLEESELQKTLKQLEKLTVLDVSYANVSNLRSLRVIPNLKQLHMRHANTSIGWGCYSLNGLRDVFPSIKKLVLMNLSGDCVYEVNISNIEEK